jgi:2',3'-cyclic-nucleotide 2'-phosphodiesterase (5'-nucleotidase family)
VKHTQLAILGVLTLAALLVAGRCMSAGKQQSFSIAWNYDTSGYLETCGCSAHQLGGLGRRATKIDQLRQAGPVLAIEGAHIVEDKGEFQLFKGQMIVQALNMMDYSAMMLGVREAQQGTDGIAKLIDGARFPVFSANMQAGDASWLKRFATVDIGGTQVGITGVSQPELVDFDLGAGVSFSDPVKALDEVLPQVKRAGLKVICLEGKPEWIEQMVTRYRGDADVFLSGNRQEGADLEFHADPPRLNCIDRGRYMGIITEDRAP